MRNILLLFTAVIILLVGSSSVEAQHKRGSNGNHRGCCQGEKSATDRAEVAASRLVKTLDLSNKQSDKVQAIYLDFFEEQEACFKENKNGERPKKTKDGRGKGNREPNREPNTECAARYKDLEAELSKVLTADQMAEYKRAMDEKKANKPKKSRGRR